MNERIRELIAEADRKCSETRGIYDEILAELIVRECITALKTSTEGYDNRAMFLMTEMINRSESILLQHFGVEE